MATGTVPAVRSQAKVWLFLLFFAATILVTYLKDGRIFDPASPIAQHFAPVRGYLAIHAFFGILAMVVAAFQFSNRLRARYRKVHRALGYVYVGSVFIAAPLASAIAIKLAPLPLVVANTMQSFAWIVTTSIALYCVRSGKIVEHRRWMIRSYPFAMVFTVVRTIQAIPSIARLGYPGREAVVWSVIVLAAFLPNIFLEWRSIFPRRSVSR